MTAALEDDFALFDIEEPASSQTTPDWAAAAHPPPTTSTELGPLLGKLSDDTLQSVLVNLAASSLAALSACSHGLRSAVERCVEPAPPPASVCSRCQSGAPVRVQPAWFAEPS